MNVQNISSLILVLTKAGFDPGIGIRIARQVCFQPAEFTLSERLQKDADLLICTLLFVRSGDEYSVSYYDAALVKSIDLAGVTIEGVQLAELEKRMAAITWNLSHRDTKSDDFREEKEIFAIVGELEAIAATAQGKFYSDYLKLKYIPGNVSPAIRQRMEVSQRFYFVKGESISIGEAYRFLINRWMEKKLKSKPAAETMGEAAASTTEPVKKRGGRKGTIKK